MSRNRSDHNCRRSPHNRLKYDFERINRQRWKYNAMGLLALLLIILLATNAGGLAHRLTSILLGE